MVDPDLDFDDLNPPPVEDKEDQVNACLFALLFVAGIAALILEVFI